MDETPRLKAAIHMASHNKGRYAYEAVQSVINQTATFPYKLFIAENSDDVVTRNLLQTIDSPKVSIAYRDDDDPTARFVEYYQNPPADYLFYMHDDCALLPEFLEKMVGELEKGKDGVYCAVEFTRKNGTIEYYTQINTVFPGPVRLAGSMENFQIGLRAEVFKRIEQPYPRPFFPLDSIKEAVISNNENMDKIEKACVLYPVLGGDGVAEVLIRHKTTEFSSWQVY